MALKKIFVSRSVVDQNHDSGTCDLVFKVIDDDGTEHRTNSILVSGPCKLKYDPDGPFAGRVWIETYDKVVLNYADDTQSDRPLMVAI